MCEHSRVGTNCGNYGLPAKYSQRKHYVLRRTKGHLAKLTVTYMPWPPIASRAYGDPRVEADLGSAERVVQLINEVAELPEMEKEEVATAFREILLNAIEQGGRFDPGQNVEIACLRARHMVICRVKDPGPGVSQEAILNTAMANRPDAPIRHAYREAQGLHLGGYGVLIARHFVDDLIYDEKGNMSRS